MGVAAANQNNDLILVDLMRQGNALAFQKIYDAYWEKLFAYTFNRLHVREASEEVVQDVFSSLWANRESLIITTSLSSYLYGATRHRLLNELRSAKVRKAYAADYASFIKNVYDNSNVEEQEVKDLQRLIEARIAELPKNCQSVFRLSRQQYVPNQTIAETLKISTKTVENYITQALKHLRTSLGGLWLCLLLMIFS
jgi:RNA polymerase sigma-70 factor (family 1)